MNDTLNFARMSFPQVGHVAVHIGIDALPRWNTCVDVEDYVVS